MNSQSPIRIAAALIRRADGRTLVVRKYNTQTFIQPGGKIEASEQPAAALCRELAEELCLELAPEELTYVGRFTAPAANETERLVDAEIFSLDLHRPVKAAAEIEEILWLDPDDVGAVDLAPLTRDKLIPLCARQTSK
jgi:8-oxo-dGTP diphosphatase